mmetsp:Transcript_51247/g.85139  ORF Transcript_51247/g.85139 Transcript_51247/m.85139 type:complete len:406 (+) Transcript_51247:22-1239(+)
MESHTIAKEKDWNEQRLAEKAFEPVFPWLDIDDLDLATRTHLQTEAYPPVLKYDGDQPQESAADMESNRQLVQAVFQNMQPLTLAENFCSTNTDSQLAFSSSFQRLQTPQVKVEHIPNGDHAALAYGAYVQSEEGHLQMSQMMSRRSSMTPIQSAWVPDPSAFVPIQQHTSFDSAGVSHLTQRQASLLAPSSPEMRPVMMHKPAEYISSNSSSPYAHTLIPVTPDFHSLQSPYISPSSLPPSRGPSPLMSGCSDYGASPMLNAHYLASLSAMGHPAYADDGSMRTFDLLACAMNPYDSPCPSVFSTPARPYTKEERAKVIQRYQEKKAHRSYKRTVMYKCRSDLANNRVRIKGRFVSNKTPVNEDPLSSDPSPPQSEPLRRRSSSGKLSPQQALFLNGGSSELTL